MPTRGEITLIVRKFTWQPSDMAAQPRELYPREIKSVIVSAAQIHARVTELGQLLGRHYRPSIAMSRQDLLLLIVLKGAVMFGTDLARATPRPL
jgi:hypoxanthine phosphoribosyltransferase